VGGVQGGTAGDEDVVGAKVPKEGQMSKGGGGGGGMMVLTSMEVGVGVIQGDDAQVVGENVSKEGHTGRGVTEEG